MKKKKKTSRFQLGAPKARRRPTTQTFVVSDAFGEIISLAAPTKEE